MIDREKFQHWLEREMERWGPPPSNPGLECFGGPIDGMLAPVAEATFRTHGASLIAPACLVLAANPGAPERLTHRYARDHRGAFVYVGVVRASEVAS